MAVGPFLGGPNILDDVEHVGRQIQSHIDIARGFFLRKSAQSILNGSVATSQNGQPRILQTRPKSGIFELIISQKGTPGILIGLGVSRRSVTW